MASTRTAVVALGGNAFTAEAGSRHLRGAARERPAMATQRLRLRAAGWNVVVVHGNGPQVGNLAIQQEEGAPSCPQSPCSASAR